MPNALKYCLANIAGHRAPASQAPFIKHSSQDGDMLLGWKHSCSDGCSRTFAVSARAPSVRPWNACVKHTSSEGAVALASYGSMPAAGRLTAVKR